VDVDQIRPFFGVAETIVLSTNTGENSLEAPTNSMRLHSAHSIPIRKSNFVAYKQGRIGDYYEDLSELGEGAYGIVSKGRNMTTGIYRAIKSVKKAFYTSNETERMI
jgi:hypothetical protein